MAIIGTFGLFGNVLTIVVLRKSQEANRNFNKLLMALAIVDSLLIIFEVGDKSIIHTFMQEFPHWYKVRKKQIFSRRVQRRGKKSKDKADFFSFFFSAT